MNIKIRNAIIFASILIFILISIFVKNHMNFDKKVYVVSPDRKKGTLVEKTDTAFKEQKTLQIVVFVSGEVKTPGIANVKAGDRLMNAVDKLGGLTQNADLNRVNLAIKLEDGCHYIVPKIGEKTEIAQEKTGNQDQDMGSESEENSKVNLNKASKVELDAMPGIGSVLADRIIKYREEKNGFKSIDDLNNVAGIGDKKLEDLKKVAYIPR